MHLRAPCPEATQSVEDDDTAPSEVLADVLQQELDLVKGEVGEDPFDRDEHMRLCRDLASDPLEPPFL